MKQIFSTENAPKAIGPYSQATQAGNMLFISGQLPIDPSSGKIDSGDIAGQARQSLQNLKAIVEDSGLGVQNIVKSTIYMTDINNFSVVNQIYSEFFPKDYPARVAVEVSHLPKDALVEIEVIACR